MDNQYPIQDGQWEEIEKFLLRNMSPEEEADFRERLSKDINLNKATDEMKLLLLGIQETSLQEKLNSFHHQMPAQAENKQAKTARLWSMKTWLAAASVMAVLFVSAYFILGKKDKNTSLYTEYFQPDPGLISAMSGAADYQFDRGMIDYKTGNYDAAIKIWEPLLKERANSDTLNYFLASAYLASDKTEKAIPFFEKVIASAISVFKNDANWYLALAHIKLGNKAKAIPYLERSEHPGKETLLNKLKD